MIAVFDTRMHESLDILGKARTTIAATGIQELRADTGIRTDTLTNSIDIGTYAFAEVGNIVHKRDTRSQHGVGGILRHFSRWDIHEDNAEIINQEGLVQARHHLLGLLRLSTDYHTVRRHEVLDGSTLLQEFRIRGHVEGNIHTALVQLCLDGGLYFLGGSYRHCRFRHQNGVLVDVLTKLFGHCQHVFQVGRTILIRGCSHS